MDPVGVEPVGVEPVGPSVGPVGVEPVGVDPFGVELSCVEPEGGESVVAMIVEVDNDDAVIVEPVNVDKVVSNVDIVVVTFSVEPIESPLLSSSLEPSSPPGIRRTHKIISKVNKSIKMTTTIIMFLVLLSFTGTLPSASTSTSPSSPRWSSEPPSWLSEGPSSAPVSSVGFSPELSSRSSKGSSLT